MVATFLPGCLNFSFGPNLVRPVSEEILADTLELQRSRKHSLSPAISSVVTSLQSTSYLEKRYDQVRCSPHQQSWGSQQDRTLYRSSLLVGAQPTYFEPCLLRHKDQESLPQEPLFLSSHSLTMAGCSLKLLRNLHMWSTQDPDNLYAPQTHSQFASTLRSLCQAKGSNGSNGRHWVGVREQAACNDGSVPSAMKIPQPCGWVYLSVSQIHMPIVTTLPGLWECRFLVYCGGSALGPVRVLPTSPPYPSIAILRQVGDVTILGDRSFSSWRCCTPESRRLINNGEISSH